MSITRRTIPAILPSLLLAVPAWAADEAHASSGAKALVGLLPILIIVGLFCFFMRRLSKRNGPYMERAMVHMERLEKQNEEVIGLLREIAGRKRPPEPPPLPSSAPAARSPQE